MNTVTGDCTPSAARRAAVPWRGACAGTWWSQHRETSLNWLALGLLLAAWNATDDETAAQARRKPEALRGYSPVSVRAAALHSGVERGG